MGGNFCKSDNTVSDKDLNEIMRQKNLHLNEPLVTASYHGPTKDNAKKVSINQWELSEVAKKALEQCGPFVYGKD